LIYITIVFIYVTSGTTHMPPEPTLYVENIDFLVETIFYLETWLYYIHIEVLIYNYISTVISCSHITAASAAFFRK